MPPARIQMMLPIVLILLQSRVGLHPTKLRVNLAKVSLAGGLAAAGAKRVSQAGESNERFNILRLSERCVCAIRHGRLLS
jgi:hypothetical protein